MAQTKRFHRMAGIWPHYMILISIIPVTSGILCGESSKWQYMFKGERTPLKNAQRVDHVKGYAYLVIDPMYTIECCGHISKWELYVKNPGTVKMQVWRPVNNESFTYELRGQTIITVTKENTDKLIVVPLPSSKYIAVNTGDVIGWSYSDIDMIMYKKKIFGNTIFRTSKMPTIKPGELFTFPLNVISDRSYAVKASLSPGNAPVFHDPPQLIDINMDTPMGTSLVNLTGSDADGQDVSNFTVLRSGDGSSYFRIDPHSGELRLTSNMSEAGLYSLGIRMLDQCGLYADTSLNILVKEELKHVIAFQQHVNRNGVTFHNLPNQIEVHEDSTQEKLLLQLNITDSSGGSDVTCFLANATSIKRAFILKSTNPNNDLYGIFLRANAKLSYDLRPFYTVFVKCFTEKQAETSTLTVNLVRNKPPRVQNLPATIFLSANSSKVGSVVYKVNSTDYENDPLFITMNCSTDLCPFKMLSSGFLICKQTMLNEIRPGFDLFIFVSDIRNRVGPFSLSILLTDMNSRPVLRQSQDVFYISENISTGTLIHTFNASDLDNDDLTFEASYQPSIGFTYFNLNASGELRVVKSLDFESMEWHVFNISISVNDGISSSKPMNRTIVVLNENEPPQFSSRNYTIFTYEGSVGSEATPKTALQVRDVDEFDDTRFYISGGKNAMNFFIDPLSGQIKFAVVYDIRIMPDTVQLNITATDKGGLESFTTLTLKIRALNWKPRLNNLPWKQMVPENSQQTGPALFIVTAFDPDLNDTKSFRVSFVPPDGATKFQINPSTGKVFISAEQILDFESGPREYILTFVVNDGTIDSKPENLTLQITDVNEPPIFKQSSYNVDTIEMKKGRRLWNLDSSMITDPDIGDEHSYSLDEGPNSTYFAFNPITNDLVFAIDYDPRLLPNHVTLTVRVTDRGGLSGTTQLHLNIQSVNKAPVIKNLPQFLMVPETTPLGTAVFTVGAFDPDPRDVLIYKARFLNPQASLKFSFNQTSGQVVLVGKLDYESMSVKEFAIEVMVSDGHLSSNQYHLTLTIIDSNEPPQFARSVYHIKTFEAQDRAMLTSETFFDVFEPDKGDVYHFKITNESDYSLFNINSTTGQLQFASNYSLATMPRRLTLNISVFDMSGLNDTTKVEITILPVNKAPKIRNLPSTIYVREDELPPGSKLYKIDVFDEDVNDSKIFQVTYDPPQGAAIFPFDTKNGEVLIGKQQVVNYESLDIYLYKIFISVSDGEASSDQGTLTLQIIDVNEAPHFSSRLYFIDVKEGKGGTNLPMSVPFEIYDPDVNDFYRFFIMKAENSNWFIIDSINGNISFAIDYDVRFLPSSVFLVVAVKDKGNLQDTALVNVTVRARNKSPYLLNLPQMVPIPENYPSQDAIITFQAHDEDPWDTITYQVYFLPTDGASRFAINQTTGVLHVLPGQNIDYETIPWKKYTLTVVAGDGTATSDPVNLTLEIIDVNEAPAFTEKVYYVSTNEGPPGTILEESKVVSSMDPDIGNQILYSLDPVDENATMFTINRTAGYLRFAVHYDCTMMPHDVTLWIIAKDQSGLTDRAEVRVLVNHLNRLPFLLNLPETIRLPEKITSRLIYVVLVKDPDPNDPVFFVATVTPSSGNEKFMIDSKNGAVTLREGQELDYETGDKYTITVTVYDGHNHTSPVTLTIIVEDINEAPSFSSTNYYISTQEGPAGTVLPNAFFEVTDPDRDEVFVYYLAEGRHQRRFRIDPNSGLISYAVDYDVDQREMPRREVLEVKVKDTGGLTAIAHIEINIEDINDNAPVFNQSSYTIFASINDPVGHRYLTIQATDADSHLNAKVSFHMDDFKEFKYFAVSETGDVYLRRPLEYDFKGDIRFLVIATDQGSPVHSSVAMVKVILQEVRSNQSLSDLASPLRTRLVAQAGYFDQPENLSWFTATVLLLTLLQVILVVLLHKWLSRKCAKEDKPAEERKVPVSLKKSAITPEEMKKEKENEVTEISEVKNILSERPTKLDEKIWDSRNISRYDFWNTGKIEDDNYLSLESSSGEISIPLQSNKRLKGGELEDPKNRFLTESGWESKPKVQPYSQLTRDRILNAWLN